MNERPAFLTLEPYQPAREAELQAAAASDENHVLILPSHTIQRDGHLVGYLSLGVATLTFPWFDTRHMKARDTLQIINTAENVCRVLGQRWSAVPFAPDSPLQPHMAALGYQSVGTFEIGLKKLL